jgi:hypothetical protein
MSTLSQGFQGNRRRVSLILRRFARLEYLPGRVPEYSEQPNMLLVRWSRVRRKTCRRRDHVPLHQGDAFLSRNLRLADDLLRLSGKRRLLLKLLRQRQRRRIAQ